MSEEHLSPHPVDLLIRRITGGSHRPIASDAEQIIERIATAPFLSRTTMLPATIRALLPEARDLEEPVPSLTRHLLTRVVVDGQWAPGTSTASYLADLRAAVLHDRSRLGVYRRRAGSIAATIAETEIIVPAEHRGEKWLPRMLVVYSADRGMIVTGYQFSTMTAVAIPEDVLWLK